MVSYSQWYPNKFCLLLCTRNSLSHKFLIGLKQALGGKQRLRHSDEAVKILDILILVHFGLLLAVPSAVLQREYTGSLRAAVVAAVLDPPCRVTRRIVKLIEWKDGARK